MERHYVEDKVFEKVDFVINKIEKAEYECCTFINCNFFEADLSNITFTDCQFKVCNISSAKIYKTGFREVIFTECKMLGLHFNICSDFLFSVEFNKCLLDLSSFYKVKLKSTVFLDTSLKDVDFSEADLTIAVLNNCDLSNAIFDNTILEKADLTTAINYSIDPELNKLKGAQFSVHGIEGLLHKYNIVIK